MSKEKSPREKANYSLKLIIFPAVGPRGFHTPQVVWLGRSPAHPSQEFDGILHTKTLKKAGTVLEYRLYSQPHFRRNLLCFIPFQKPIEDLAFPRG